MDTLRAKQSQAGKVSCMKICVFNQIADDCLSPYETFNHPNYQEIMIITSVSDMYVIDMRNPCAPPQFLNLTPPTATEWLGAQQFATSLIPAVKDLSLQLSYEYMAEQALPYPSSRSTVSAYASSLNASTVVLDGNGIPVQVWPAGQDIIIKLPQMIAMSRGLPAGYAAELPLVRDVWMNGAEIIVQVDCYSDEEDVSSALTDLSGGSLASQAKQALINLKNRIQRVIDIDNPLCVVHFSWSSAPGITGAEYYVITDQSGPETGQLKLLRKSKGLRIRSEKGFGTKRAVDLNAIVLALTSALVLLSIPKRILTVFIKLCLGHLSRIYRRMLVEDFDIKDQCGSVAVRLMTHSVPFVELADTADILGRAGISKRRLKERFREMVKHRRAIDDSELEALVEFCYEQAITSAGPAQHALHWRSKLRFNAKEMKEDPDRAEKGQPEGEAGAIDPSGKAHTHHSMLDIDAFSSACSANEPMNFEAVVDLFDKDRKLGFLERFFMPKPLWKAIYDIKANTTAEGEPTSPALVKSLTVGGGAMLNTGSDTALTLEEWKRRNQETVKEVKVARERILELLDKSEQREQTVVTVREQLAALDKLRLDLEVQLREQKEELSSAFVVAKRQEEATHYLEERLNLVQTQATEPRTLAGDLKLRVCRLEEDCEALQRALQQVEDRTAAQSSNAVPLALEDAAGAATAPGAPAPAAGLRHTAAEASSAPRAPPGQDGGSGRELEELIEGYNSDVHFGLQMAMERATAAESRAAQAEARAARAEDASAALERRLAALEHASGTAPPPSASAASPRPTSGSARRRVVVN